MGQGGIDEAAERDPHSDRACYCDRLYQQDHSIGALPFHDREHALVDRITWQEGNNSRNRVDAYRDTLERRDDATDAANHQRREKGRNEEFLSSTLWDEQ